MSTRSRNTGFLAGGLAGAGTGAAIGTAFAGPTLGVSVGVGAALGFIAGAGIGVMQADEAEDLAREEEQAILQAKNEALSREFGIQQQKAAANFSRSRSNANRSGDATASQVLTESGFMSQGMLNSGSTTPAPSSASGTF